MCENAGRSRFVIKVGVISLWIHSWSFQRNLLTFLQNPIEAQRSTSRSHSELCIWVKTKRRSHWPNAYRCGTGFCCWFYWETLNTWWHLIIQTQFRRWTGSLKSKCDRAPAAQLQKSPESLSRSNDKIILAVISLHWCGRAKPSTRG